MAPARIGLALSLAGLCVACASKPPPPPVIETQEAELAPTKPRPEPSSIDSAGPAPTSVDVPGVKPGPTNGTATSPEIELLEPGAEPRRELRHVFKKGSSEKLSIKAKTHVKGASMPLPSMSMNAPMDAQIIELSKTGDARFKFKAGPFKTSMGGGGELGALGGMLGNGAPEKIAGWGWITPQGVVREFHVEEGGNDGDAPVENGDPFPLEAVGVGARWEVRAMLEEKDGPVSQTSTYELLSVDKKAVHTKVHRVQAPLGSGGDSAPGNATSDGELTFRFADVYPTGSLRMVRALKLDMPGLDGEGMKIDSEVTIGKR
jgi:hypothetical protein